MYKLIGTNAVKRLTDGVHIPFADGNIDYEEYKQWLEEGNIPKPEFSYEEIQKQELQIKINEAKEYLASTDHKLYNGYKPKEGEDLVEIERLRDEARDFIRANEIK